MTPIVTIGEILVEIMAAKRGQGFLEAGPFIGPFASGAPAIFIDQVARLGHPCGILACVGDDDFGRLNIDRLARDGVDVSAIQIDPERPTGHAFVRYDAEGNRDFIFNIVHSAAGQLSATDATERMVEGAGHIHVMGTSLFAPSIVALVRTAVDRVKARGGTVSFDPNIRKELAKTGLRDMFDFVLERCDLLMPSGPELMVLMQAGTEGEALQTCFARGVGAVLMKRGAEGARYVDHDNFVDSPAFAVDEIDPTGAGDCFGATFLTCRRLGLGIESALRYANASGARTVTVKGPMEGASTFIELDRFIAATPLRHAA